MSRIALVASGSGGDLFPILATAGALEESGHEVVILAPRLIAVMARGWGQRVIGVGSASAHHGIGTDRGLITAGDDGLDAWQTFFERYAAKEISASTQTRRIFEKMAIEAVVAHPFAFFGKLAASALELPVVGLQLFPSLLSRLDRIDPSFAPVLSGELRLAEKKMGLTQTDHPLRSWLTNGTNLLAHEEWLASDRDRLLGLPFVGYPYNDRIAPQSAFQADLDWVSQSEDPVVAFSMGTLVGLSHEDMWTWATDVSADLGISALLLNAPRIPSTELPDRMRGAPFVPISYLGPCCAAFVHVGGLGFTYGSLEAGVPSVVVPMAFDQGHNAELLERSGAGLSVGWGGWSSMGTALERVLADGRFEQAAQLCRDRINARPTSSRRIAAHVEALLRSQAPRD